MAVNEFLSPKGVPCVDPEQAETCVYYQEGPGAHREWTRGGWGRSALLYQVAFCFSFQLFPRLVQDGRDHTEEGERLPWGPESKETLR